MKICVIGGGIFGSQISIDLAEKGHKVSNYESQSSLLLGASRSNQNRLHKGLHYPRDLETAIQSRIGFEEFRVKYPEIINLSFPNYYGVSKHNSKTTKLEFEAFAKKAKIDIYPQLSVDLLNNFGLDKSMIDGVYLSEEGVIDIPRLRSKFLELFDQENIETNFETTVNKIRKLPQGWEVSDSKRGVSNFDMVIKATYGQDNILIVTDKSIVRPTYEYQRTIVLEVACQAEPFGLTIVDGDFFTILPSGFSSNFLLYGPSISTVERHVGKSVPYSWEYIESELEEKTGLALLERAKKWLPNLEFLNVHAHLSTIRTIPPNSSHTDSRRSEVLRLDENLYDVCSGKLDHSISVSKEFVKIVSTMS